MSQHIELEVAPRTVMGKATRHLRREGILPANIYGHKEAPVAIQVDAVAFDRLRREHGIRNVVSLQLPGSPQTALVHKVQHEPRTGKILHVDFTRVSMSELIEVKIPLRFVGESAAVKNEGGVLLHLLDAIAVECKASDIGEAIEVDISPLAEIDAALHARDVKLPDGYKLLTDPDEAIAKVAPTRAEVTTAEVTATPEAAAPAQE